MCRFTSPACSGVGWGADWLSKNDDGFALASSAVTGPRQNLGTTRFALHVAGGEKGHQETFGLEGQPCWVVTLGHLTHSCENVSPENWKEHCYYSSILLSNVPMFFGLIW